MLYKREISDPIMIQYIILYALACAGRIVTHDQLASIVMDNCNIKFTDFRIAVDHLEKIGYIVVVPENNGRGANCGLLPQGKQANGFFYRSIPAYIREPIEKYIAPFFKEEERKRSVRAELLPLNEDEFMAELSIYDGKTPMMKLSVYAGSREYANSMINEFKKDPQRVYETVIELVGNGELESENEEKKENIKKDET